MNADSKPIVSRALAETLPHTRALALKVASVHGHADGRLVELRDTVEDFLDSLVDKDSAPEARALVADYVATARSLTGNYDFPAWGCGTLLRYFEALATLDEALCERLDVNPRLVRPPSIAM